jgi:DNA helicase-2/ATP-dependent DNA helicase PcrA
MQFNKEQQMVINNIEGACGVIAGAGSGKSTTLVERVKNMIENKNINSEDILIVTFTDNSSKD